MLFPSLVSVLLGVLWISACSGCDWEANQIDWSKDYFDGHYQMQWVSVGPAGVWAVRNGTGVAYYKRHTYGSPNRGDGWWLPAIVKIVYVEAYGYLLHSGHTDVTFTQLDVGTDVMWAVTDFGEVCYRIGITRQTPTGEHWVFAWSKSRSPLLTHVTVSAQGTVWAVGKDGTVYRRTGITSSSQGGDGWTEAGAGKNMRQVSAGGSGLWGVDDRGQVWYRLGTYGDTGEHGTDWQQVPNLATTGKVRSISASDDFALVVSEDDTVWRRKGVSAEDPDGNAWVQVAERMTQMDTYGCYLWGIADYLGVKFSKLNDAVTSDADGDVAAD